MQAIVCRAMRQEAHSLKQTQVEVNATCFTNLDYGFLREVISGSSEVLQTATRLALSGKLGFMPVRQSLCIISATIFLLKGLNIGSSHLDIQSPLKILDQCLAALRSSSIDDMEISSRFASLIGKHISAFRASIAPSHDIFKDPVSLLDSGPSIGIQTPNTSNIATEPDCNSLEMALSNAVSVGSDWLSQSFDPSVAPFSANNYISSLEVDSLDFLWNLPDPVD